MPEILFMIESKPLVLKREGGNSKHLLSDLTHLLKVQLDFERFSLVLKYPCTSHRYDCKRLDFLI